MHDAGQAGQLGTIQWAATDLAHSALLPSGATTPPVVVCDPPWYPEGFATFLYAAALLVRPGGAILVSVPDLLTRPTVADELEDSQPDHQLRLATSAIEPCAVRYRTPFFEYRALRAAGVRVIPLDWRAGTLWQLTSTGIAPPMRSRPASGIRCQPNGRRDHHRGRPSPHSPQASRRPWTLPLFRVPRRHPTYGQPASPSPQLSHPMDIRQYRAELCRPDLAVFSSVLVTHGGGNWLGQTMAAYSRLRQSRHLPVAMS